MITICDEYGVVLDPDTMRLGEARLGFYKVSMSPLEEQLDVIDDAVDDLFNVLDPTSSFKIAQPNREGIMAKAGFTTFFMLGVTFGVLAVALIFLALGGV
ncbi:MAG: tetrahydromethanopterin S-methyltransferase subunit MtrB [Candidatus Methanospirareceae archaeon]